jgi:hypothetical protein
VAEHVAAEESPAEEPARAPAAAGAPAHSGPTVAAGGVPENPVMARQLAGTIGNRAFTQAVLARDPGPDAAGGGGTATAPAPEGSTASAATPATAPGAPLPLDTEYQSTPNLRGAVPVRSRAKVPNPNVIEDVGEYTGLRDQAQAALVRQRERAKGYLDEHGRLKDYRYFFAKVYSFVTENEIGFCESGAFFYPSYVLKCVLFFEKLYDDNVRAFDTPGANVEDHWKEAFQQTAQAQKRAEDAYALMLAAQAAGPEAQGGAALNAVTQNVLGAMQSMTVSMKAHIRYDLPRAEAWVYNGGYRQMPGVQQNDFMSDFMSMSGVFDKAGEAMLPDMAEKLGVPVDLVPRMVQDTSMSYLFGADMATERADTWRRALAMGAEHPDDVGPYSRGPGGALQGDTTAGDHMSNITGLADPNLRPSMDSAMDSGDDDSAHADLDAKSDADIAALPAVRRVQYLRALCAGVTGGSDEALVLRILRASSADLAVVVDGADAWDLMYALDGANATALRTLLQGGYYASTALATGLRLVRRCMDGETAEWEEEMVADIVVARSDRVDLIKAIGRGYPSMNGSDDFHKGLNKLEWQLDGDDETRVHAVLGTDAAAPDTTSGEWW